MMLRSATLVAALAIALASAQAHAQAPDSMHMQHMHGVETRGDQAMGFSHANTMHRFVLYKDGGAIVVTANQPTDSASIQHIRTHLPHVAMMFSQGDFSMPMFIHDQTPPGVPTMKRLRQKIDYAYTSIASGGRVRITTKDKKALGAIHDFLRFQIKDHATGDPLEVQPDPAP